MQLSGEQLAADLGPLPPMRIHCGQLVEGALRNALTGAEQGPAEWQAAAASPEGKEGKSGSLLENFAPGAEAQRKIVFLDPPRA